MGTLSIAGVWFKVFSFDHLPPHVHAQCAELEVILDLVPGGGVRISSRADALKPPNAKQSDLRRVLRAAKLNEDALRKLWEQTHERRTHG